MDDKDLLLLLSSSPNEGIAATLSLYGAVINAIVTRVLPYNRQDAEECVADALVALWQNAAKITQRQTPIKPWLIITARNLAINRYNKLRRNSNLPLDENIEDVKHFIQIQQSDSEDLVAALVINMSAPDKEIFIRKYYLLETAAQIARALHMTEQNIYTHLSRGREKLREGLSNEEAAI